MSKELRALRKQEMDLIVSKDPEIATMTLAKRLFQESKHFGSTEQARSFIRYYRGETGTNHRKRKGIEKPMKKRQINTPIGNIVPPSDDAPEKVEPVSLKLEGHGTIMSDIHLPYHDVAALEGAGVKHDKDKFKPRLIIEGFSRALTEVARVGTFGADKYTENGWESVENGVERYTDAMYRHLLDEAKGDELDPESGLQHAAHAAWNALSRLELMLRKEDI